MRGSDSTKTTRFGALNFASRPASADRIAASVTAAPGPGDDDRRHPLAEIGVRNPDDGAFEHAVDRVDMVLHLLRIDVEAAGNDQILGAADDVDVAVGVDLPEIAGDEIAVRAELLRPSFPASASSRETRSAP